MGIHNPKMKVILNFTKDLLDLCHWSARYYQHPIGEVFSHALPTLLRQGEPASFRQDSIWVMTLKGSLIDIEALQKKGIVKGFFLGILMAHKTYLLQLISLGLGLMQISWCYLVNSLLCSCMNL